MIDFPAVKFLSYRLCYLLLNDDLGYKSKLNF